MGIFDQTAIELPDFIWIQPLNLLTFCESK